MKHKKSPPGQRQLRVGEEIRHIIASALMHGGFDDPDLVDSSLVTVTEVRISPDLKHATAYVMMLGRSNEMGTILAALNGEAHHFQREIARVLKTRFTPKIVFKYDDSFNNAQRIESILYDIKKNTPPEDDQSF